MLIGGRSFLRAKCVSIIIDVLTECKWRGRADSLRPDIREHTLL